MFPKKKFLLTILFLLFVCAFFALAFGEVQAAGISKTKNTPPLCFPINSPNDGFWGMSCIDEDNNISSVELQTISPDYYLIWDNSYADMIVQFDGNPEIYWQVCDASKACVEGTYPTP